MHYACLYVFLRGCTWRSVSCYACAVTDTAWEDCCPCAANCLNRAGYQRIYSKICLADLNACTEHSFFCSAVLTPQHYHWYAATRFASPGWQLAEWTTCGETATKCQQIGVATGNISGFISISRHAAWGLEQARCSILFVAISVDVTDVSGSLSTPGFPYYDVGSDDGSQTWLITSTLDVSVLLTHVV